MSPKVKIAMAAVNVACLLVTLLSPATITPLVLLTTIASTVTWAFTTQERTALHRHGLHLYIGGASLLSIVCIVLGTTTSISRPCPEINPGKYEFTFDSNIAGLAGTKFDYLFFAVVMFLSITGLMAIEIYSSLIMEDLKKSEDLPIAHRINQQLKSMP